MFCFLISSMHESLQKHCSLQHPYLRAFSPRGCSSATFLYSTQCSEAQNSPWGLSVIAAWSNGEEKAGPNVENAFLVPIAATSVLLLPSRDHRLTKTQQANQLLALSCCPSSQSLPSSHECPFPFSFLRPSVKCFHVENFRVYVAAPGGF